MIGLTNLARLQSLQRRLRQATATYTKAAQVLAEPEVLIESLDRQFGLLRWSGRFAAGIE